MSDQPADPPPGPSYATDDDHDRIYLELVDVDGRLLASVPVAPPLNKNATTQVAVQVTIAHLDGCTRTLGRWAIPPY